MNDEPIEDITFEPEDNEAPQSSFKKQTKDEQVAKLEAALEQAKAEKEEYLQGWQRSKADYVNARKREDEDRKSLLKFAEANLISEIIPTLDSFDMAMGNKEQWGKADKNWRTGIEYIYSQLSETLKSHGLKKINPVGEMFDPNLHHSVELIHTEKADDDGKILEVTTCGYSLNGKIIREAQVRVGEFKTDDEPAGGDTQANDGEKVAE